MVQEWVDAYWAKDIQELFRLERRASFQRFLELLLAQSVVAHDVDSPFERKYGEIAVRFEGLPTLARRFAAE